MDCIVYKGKRRGDNYLFVEREGDFSRVPAVLLELLGGIERVMELELRPERRLAQADAAEVMRLLREQGYYLQLPPYTGVRQ